MMKATALFRFEIYIYSFYRFDVMGTNEILSSTFPFDSKHVRWAASTLAVRLISFRRNQSRKRGALSRDDPFFLFRRRRFIYK